MGKIIQNLTKKHSIQQKKFDMWFIIPLEILIRKNTLPFLLITEIEARFGGK